MIESTPVAVTLASNSRLAEHLRGALNGLRDALEPGRLEVELTEADEADYPALDPAVVSFFFEVGKIAGHVVIELVAKELCVWLWREAAGWSRKEAVPETVALSIGGTRLTLPTQPLESEREREIEKAKAALELALE